ncbi:MAG: hypothetical protein IPF78_13520 [Flavobacteriales bacterium]|nr:hypothetical protein [Flavobacteriales bacterium]
MSDPTKDDVSLLSPEYDALFAKAVEGFVARMRGEPAYLNEEYCLFYPSFGNPEKKRSDIIVYGQAPNTWEIKINLNKWDLVPVVLTRDARNFSNTVDDPIDEVGPLDWINLNWSAYQLYRSFFWQTSYKVVSDYHGFDRERRTWCEHLVWSNLMKIAPAEGGNPDMSEYAAHEPKAVELFQLELDELKPKYAIVLTNWEWAEPFINHLGIELPHKIDPDQMIHWHGSCGPTKIIVTKRPYIGGRSDDYAAEILKLMDKGEHA